MTTSVALKGRLNPYELSASGEARAQRLKIDAFEADDVKFRWLTDGDQVALNDLEAMLYGGKVTGTAVLPTKLHRPGKLDLSIHELEVKQLARDLHLPFRMAGQVNGLLKGTLPAAVEGQARTASLSLDLQAAKMRVQNIPTEQLHGTIDYRKGGIDYKLEGKTLGGAFDLEGQIPSAPKQAAPKKGRFSVRKVHLGRLLTALALPTNNELKGELNIDVDFSHDTADRIPEGKGVLRINNLRLKDTLPAHDVQGDIVLANDQLRLANLTGSVAQGTLSRQGNVPPWKEPDRELVQRQHRSRGSRTNPGAVVGRRHRRPAPRAHSRQARRRLERLRRSRIGARQVVFGFGGDGNGHLPVTWNFARRAKADSRSTCTKPRPSAKCAAEPGKMHLAWDHSARVKGSLHFTKVDLREFLRPTLGSTEVGSGQMSGRFDFTGNDMRSIKDLEGNLVVSLSQSQTLRIPVLSQVAPILGLMGAGTTFQTGELRVLGSRAATCASNIFTLENNNLQLFIDGAVSLEGRLNLGVVAKVGNLGVPTDRLRLLGMRIPATGSIPVPVLGEATNLLSRRLLYVQVTGTVRSPVVQPRTLPLLTSEVVRFFVGQPPVKHRSACRGA